MDVEQQTNEDGTTTVVVTEMTEGEISNSQDGGIVIHLGAEEAEKYGVVRKREPGEGGTESNEEIQKFLDNYGSEGGARVPPKETTARKPKQKFQCPKCDKVWSWPWELRRHVMTHYKEVSS